jgi:hypothetical protein
MKTDIATQVAVETVSYRGVRYSSIACMDWHISQAHVFQCYCENFISRAWLGGTHLEFQLLKRLRQKTAQDEEF